MPHFSKMTRTAAEAIKMWHQQYGFASRKLADGSDSGDISKKLRDLKRPTKSQVNKIIGWAADGWTTIWCNGCHEYKAEVVSFDTGDYSAEICEECLRAALKMFR